MSHLECIKGVTQSCQALFFGGMGDGCCCQDSSFSVFIPEHFQIKKKKNNLGWGGRLVFTPPQRWKLKFPRKKKANATYAMSALSIAVTVSAGQCVTAAQGRQANGTADEP